MNVLVTGADTALADLVSLALARRGHDALTVADPSHAAPCDVVVDVGRPNAEEIRALAARTGDAKYVLLSTTDVYPPSARPRPWREGDIDLSDDAGLSGVAGSVRAAREAEQAVRMLRGRWTAIVRAAWIERAGDPRSRTWWATSRVVDGGPLILPDVALSPYKQVFLEDLAEALALIATDARTNGRTLDVASQGVLNVFGHAGVVMEALGRTVNAVFVPTDTWRAAGLALPFTEAPATTLVDASTLLAEIGWTPGLERDRITALAKHFAENPLPIDLSARDAERRVLREAEQQAPWNVEPGKVAGPRRRDAWMLVASPGEPASLHVRWSPKAPGLGSPAFAVRGLAMGASVRRMLVGEEGSRWPGPRTIGNNAVLELLEPGRSGLRAGAMFLANAVVATSGGAAWRGLDCDGFGASVVTPGVDELVEIPSDLGMLALLADPLATVRDALVPVLARSEGPVWICGSDVEARLAAWIVEDAGRRALLVDRAPGRRPGFAGVQDLWLLEPAALQGREPRPTLVIDLADSGECARLLVAALVADGTYVGRRRPESLAEKREFVEIGRGAGSTSALASALLSLRRWALFRDLSALLGPGIPIEAASDAFLTPPLQLAWIDAGEGR